MPNWTKEQREVISYRGGNLLVSAAAGSGKTAVLVERIISMVTDPDDPVSLQDLLVMTFTSAAAAEMRERVRAALEERLMQEPGNMHLIREAGSIQNANINTIDAFCKRLITENYAAIDLDPGFRVGDAGELKLLQADVLEELLEERYAEADAGFLRFVDAFAQGKEDAGIDELIFRVYDFSQSMPWPGDWFAAQRRELGGSGEPGHPAAAWEQWFLRYLKQRLEDMREVLEQALWLCEGSDGPGEYIENLNSILAQVQYAAAAETLERCIKAFGLISFERFKRSDARRKGEVSVLRDMVKDAVKKLCESVCLLEGEEAARAESGMRASILELLSLAEDFSARYAAEKEKRHILDFSDLEHFALCVLYTREEDGTHRPSALADDYARRLREILVDEYQDSNYVQETLIEALSAERFGRPDVFQVGDIKQSIYAFRLARPDLFLRKYTDPSYPKIELFQNFRSRRAVIERINDIFYRVMQHSVGGIDYTEKAALHPGREEADSGEPAERFRMEVLLEGAESDGTDGRRELDSVQAEAKMISVRIRELLKEGWNYRDIVILMRSPGAWADTVVEALGADGIPAYAATSKGYFSAVEVETVLALLSLIDNPRQDIPLAAVMRSPIYCFTDSELALVSRAQGGSLQRSFAEAAGELPVALAEKLAGFWTQIDAFREQSHYLNIHELLYQIYERTGYYNYVTALPAGAKRRANLDALVDYALAFEQTSYKGLFSFIRYIEKLRKHEEDQGEASVYSEQDNLVRVMSIHKSKGLQFPVVFVSGLGRRFNRLDLTQKILMDPELGIACDFMDTERRLRVPSLKRTALKYKLISEQLGEELRVLYVALSRAQDKLILTGNINMRALPEEYDDGGEGGRKALNGLTILSAGCMMDWVMMGLAGDRSAYLRYYGQEDLLRESVEGFERALDLNAQVQDLLRGTAADSGRAERERSGEAAGQEAEQSGSTGSGQKTRMDAGCAVLPETFSGTAELEAQLRRDFAYRYPHEEATRLYPKHSVSEIKEAQSLEYAGDPYVLDMEGRVRRAGVSEQAGSREAVQPGFSGASGSETMRTETDEIRQSGAVAPQKTAEDSPKKTAAGAPEKTGGAARGTAYHRALAFYDYSKRPEQLCEILSEAEYRMIEPARIAAFADAPLGRLFARAQREGRLFREQHFMQQVPYSYLFPEGGTDEPVLLQGIIDAYVVEDDGIVLADYKTDRTDAETLRARYQKQLDLYADALYHILKKPVKRKLIYSLHLGREIELA